MSEYCIIFLQQLTNLNGRCIKFILYMVLIFYLILLCVVFWCRWQFQLAKFSHHRRHGWRDTPFACPKTKGKRTYHIIRNFSRDLILALLAKLFSSLKLCITINTFCLDKMCSMRKLSKITKIMTCLILILNIQVKSLNFTPAKIST